QTFSPPSCAVPRKLANPDGAAATIPLSAGQNSGSTPASAARMVADSPAWAVPAHKASSEAKPISARQRHVGRNLESTPNRMSSPSKRNHDAHRLTGSVSTGDFPLASADCSENRMFTRVNVAFDV